MGYKLEKSRSMYEVFMKMSSILIESGWTTVEKRFVEVKKYGVCLACRKDPVLKYRHCRIAACGVDMSCIVQDCCEVISHKVVMCI